MNFTQDWFTHNIPNFEKCMFMAGLPRTRFLEIGSYEGRSTCWLLSNLAIDGKMVSIDPFPNMPEVEERFWNNVREVMGKRQLIQCKTTSYLALSQLIQQEQEFDFIYIDGVHSPLGVLTDACMAWGLLRKNGVMLFDDYEYPQEPTKIGIDAFLKGFEGQYEIVLQNYQLAVKKK
jgi:predicted O-methyltransferase YrrM